MHAPCRALIRAGYAFILASYRRASDSGRFRRVQYPLETKPKANFEPELLLLESWVRKLVEIARWPPQSPKIVPHAVISCVFMGVWRASDGLRTQSNSMGTLRWS